MARAMVRWTAPILSTLFLLLSQPRPLWAWEGEQVFSISSYHHPVMVLTLLLAFTVLMGFHIFSFKRAEKALTESEERYQSLFNNHTSILLIDKNTRKIVDANPSACRFYGYKIDEMRGKKIMEINVIPDDEVYKTMCLAESNRQNHFIFQHRLANGSIRDVEVYSCPVLIGGKTLLSSIINDITDRLNAEKKLVKKEQYYRSIINSIHEDITVIDKEFKIVDVNHCVLEKTGTAHSELIGRCCHEAMHKSSHPCIIDGTACKIKEVFETGKSVTQIHQHPRADGSVIWEEALFSPLKNDEGETALVIESVRDISELKRTKREKTGLEHRLRQAEKMEAVGRLAGGVAHDFNNMLNVIIGYAELITSQLSPHDPLIDYLEEIQKAGNRSAEITRQLLAFSRKQEISPKAIRLNMAISGMKKLLARLIGEDIEILFSPEKELWRIKMDPSQVDQIMANLSVNARDAMPDGGTLTIRTANVIVDDDCCRKNTGVVPGHFVMLSVSDNGRGIDREILPNIFEPFFTTKDKNSGTGLGLATVYGIVKQNKGFITVSSEPGQGTTFKIYLPRYEGESNQMESPAGKKSPSPTGKKILMVEDEEIVRNLVKSMLESLGCDVLTAETPEEALRLCEKDQAHIDLLLTDVIMPRMNGRELKRAVEAHISHIRTIFMSGYTANAIADRNILDEGVHFIQKPFTKVEIEEKIREALSP